MSRQKDTVEEKEVHRAFRATRDNLIKKIKAYETDALALDEVTDAIRLQYSVVARLEDELNKIPTDEELNYELEEFVYTEYDPTDKTAYTKIPEKTYNRLLKRVEKLESKASRVNLLELIGKQARLLTQNITASAQIGELQANTKRIELTTHNATLIALMKMVYLSLTKLGHPHDVLVDLANELKRIKKDYPLIETDYVTTSKLLFAQPEEVSHNIEEADFEDVDEKLQNVNSLVTRSSRKSRR